MARKLGRCRAAPDLDDGRTKKPRRQGSLSPGPSVRDNRVDRTGAAVVCVFGSLVPFGGGNPHQGQYPDALERAATKPFRRPSDQYELQSETGYIDARPHHPDRRNLLAPHGRTIQWVRIDKTQYEHNTSA